MTARQGIDRVERVVAERLVGRIRWIPPRPPDQETAELDRLRNVVITQQRQIADLTEKLRTVEAERRRVPVKTLIESVLDAVEAAASTLEGHAIASAHAEIKAALEIDGEMHGLALGSPSAFPPEALSTISFDIGPAPRSARDAAREAAAAELRSALLLLQASLDQSPAERGLPEALAGASALLDSDVSSAEQLRPLLQALEGLAAATPALVPAVGFVAAAVRGAEPGSPSQLSAAADAVRRVAAALDSLVT